MKTKKIEVNLRKLKRQLGGDNGIVGLLFLVTWDLLYIT